MIVDLTEQEIDFIFEGLDAHQHEGWPWVEPALRNGNLANDFARALMAKLGRIKDFVG